MDRCLQTENNPQLLLISLTLPPLPFSFPVCFFSRTSFSCPLPSPLPWTGLRPTLSPRPGYALLFPTHKRCDAGDGWKLIRSHRALLLEALTSWVRSQSFPAISLYYAVIITLPVFSPWSIPLFLSILHAARYFSGVLSSYHYHGL